MFQIKTPSVYWYHTLYNRLSRLFIIDKILDRELTVNLKYLISEVYNIDIAELDQKTNLAQYNITPESLIPYLRFYLFIPISVKYLPKKLTINNIKKLIYKIYQYCNCSEKDFMCHLSSNQLSVSEDLLLKHIQTVGDHTPQYMISCKLNIQGHFDLNLFLRSIKDICLRHYVLQQTFDASCHEQYRQFNPVLPPNIYYHDLVNKGGREACEYYDKLHRQLDIKLDGIERLYRFDICKLDEEDYCFYVSLHHIIVDGISIFILLRDILFMYFIYTKNSKPRLPNVYWQANHYAYWEQQFIKKKSTQKKIYALNNYLSHISTLNYFPPEQSNGRLETFRVSHLFENEAYERYSKQAKFLGASFYFLVAAAIFITLHRYAKDKVVAMRTVKSRRERLEIINSLGYFADGVLMMSIIDKKMTIANYLKRLQYDEKKISGLQPYPIEQILTDLKKEPALFTASIELNYINTMTDIQLGDLNINLGEDLTNRCGWRGPYYGVNLSFNMIKIDGGMSLYMTCNENYSESYCQNYLDAVIRVMDDLINKPDELIHTYIQQCHFDFSQ